MKKHICIVFIFIIIISSFLCDQQVSAFYITTRCMLLDTPNCDHSVNINKNNLPITIRAKCVRGNYPDNLIFKNNVNISQGDSHLQADEVQLHQSRSKNTDELIRTINALGNVHYSDNNVILQGSKGWINQNTKDIDIWNGNYKILYCHGKGKANIIKQRSKSRFTIFERGSFTFCPSNYNNIWNIMSSRAVHDHEKQIIEMWNARFKFGSIPVFYIPYLYIPVGNKRRSGFLKPNAEYNNSHLFEFYLPYYWNIGPNMDMTIKPHYIHKYNNIVWENELRYLTHDSKGSIEIDYLRSNKTFRHKCPISKYDKQNHWLFYWQHTSTLNRVLQFDVNYSKVSDSCYFDNFISKHSFNIDDYFIQSLSANYKSNNFNVILSTKNFQVFNKNLNKSYVAKPQFSINWYKNNIGPFDTNLYAQAVHFVNINSNMPEATRLHLESTINLPLINNWASLNTEVKLMATHYQQKNVEWYNMIYNTDLKNSVNRIIPQFKVDGKLIFERNINLPKIPKSYIQILEPHIKYLYIPYHNQNKIENYDSSLMPLDYSSIFRDRPYAGLDRISSACQIATGIISRIYDDTTSERFNISVGQIYHFIPPHTYDDTYKGKKENKTSSLILAGDTYWHMTNNWGIRSSLLYDVFLKNIVNSSTIEYNYDKDHIIQLTYRHTKPEYVQFTFPSSNILNKKHKELISQIGGIAGWSIANRYSIVGAYYFDTNLNKPVDQMIGLQYNSYCHAFRISYERKLNEIGINNNQVKYDGTIRFNIELRNLSSNLDLGIQQMLQSNFFPYHSLI